MSSHTDESPCKKRKTIVDGSVLGIVPQHSTHLGKPAILNEPIIEQENISDMDAIVKHGDLRKILGIKDSTVMEVKWCFEYEDKEDEVKWVVATIHEYETGRTHRVWNCDDEDEKTEETDYQDVPIVSIHYSDEKDEYHDICFLGDHIIYDIETDTPLSWRFFGDTYEEGDSEDEDEETILMHCDSEEDLKRQINEFVPSMFINILQKYTERVNSLPQPAIDAFTKQTLEFKKILSDRIFEHFVGKDGMKEGQVMCLARDDVDELIQKCLEDVNNI